MAAKTKYEDALLDFSGGMNSGVAPLLLDKNQLAFAMNVSLRGGFVKTRPPIQKKTLDFGGDSILQGIVLHGLFQGAGYYRPDYGAESLLAQISGHLILFTSNGTSWLVKDVSVPGDLNDSAIFQVWMWQSEKWMIIQDGTGRLPIFFDGTSSRRSNGPAVLWGTTSADFIPPAIGATVAITLTSDFLGRYNEPLILNGEFYEALSGTEVGGQPTYLATLTNVSDTPGTVIALGTSIMSIPATSSTNITLNRTLTLNWTLAAGQCIPAGTLMWSAAASTTVGIVPGVINLVDIYGQPDLSRYSMDVNGNISVFTPICNTLGKQATELDTYPAGQVIQTVTHNGVSYTLGIAAEAFTVPAVGATVIVKLTSLYSGAPQACTIWGKNYQISTASQQAPPGPTTTLTVKNLSDTKTTAVAPRTLYSVPELPAGRMGAYGMGCNAMCLTDGLSYIIGDVVGAGSGTAANNYRDSVLKMTQSAFLAGGGSFRLPGSGDIITSLFFPPVLDASLGQGPLQIGTAFSIWSNYVIGTYPGNWDTLTSPIQTESLKDKGPVGFNSTVIVNSDTFFRSSEGVGTLVLARRDFTGNTWGNVPVSNELQRVLNPDSQSLLSYGSGMTFDNRYFTTLAPIISPHGIYHIGFGVLNFDLISSLRTKLPPAWEGAWTGINALQVLTGRINGVKRAFAFTFNINQDNIIELYEFLPDNTTSYQDNDQVPIFSVFETPLIFSRDIKALNELCQLQDGEVYFGSIRGDVKVKVLYRPDYYPCWTVWNEFEICQASDASNSQPGYRMRIGLGEPDVTPCEPGNNRPLREGYFFQLRFEITGSCVFKGVRAVAISKPQQELAPVECTKAGCQIIDCDVPQDLYEYSLQGTIPPAPPPPPPPPPPQIYANQTVYSYIVCAGTITFTGTLPAWITLDLANSRFIGASGTYTGPTQASANSLAQVALDGYNKDEIANGELSCLGPASCDGTDDTVTYIVPGYFDGLVQNLCGNTYSSTLIWDGSFSKAGPCTWSYPCGVGGGYTKMDGGIMLTIEISYQASPPSWVLSLVASEAGVGVNLWVGVKLTGKTCAGTYNAVPGLVYCNSVYAPMPPAITVAKQL